MLEPIPVLVLFGPTASGKTSVLEQLFTGSAVQAEIVSADSMQVYKGMDIGTAKPSLPLRDMLPHHLIDIRTPDQSFNAGDFVRLADICVKDIAERGKLPVLSGGTGFYLKNFIQGLPSSPPSDEGIRRQLKEEVQTRGIDALAAELAACDSVSAARIHINDTYRLLRGLEVFRLTGKPLSSFPIAASDRSRYRFLTIGLERPREELYRRIDERCRQMFRDGLAGEVRSLAEAGYGPDAPGMRAIGYREFFTDGSFSPCTEADLIAIEHSIAKNSRHYAKRQITFFASIPDVVWIDASGGDAAGEIRKRLTSEGVFNPKDCVF